MVLGYAYLTKEVAGLFAPLPAVLYLIARYQGAEIDPRKLAYTYVPAGVIFGAWASYVIALSGEPLLVFGNKGSIVVRALAGETTGGGGGGLAGSVLSLPWTLFFFLKAYVVSRFSIGPLLALAWAAGLYDAVTNRAEDILFAAFFLLLTPLIVFTVRADYRAGQFLFFYLLGFVLIGWLLVAIVRKLSRVLHNQTDIPTLIPSLPGKSDISIRADRPRGRRTAGRCPVHDRPEPRPDVHR